MEAPLSHEKVDDYLFPILTLIETKENAGKKVLEAAPSHMLISLHIVNRFSSCFLL